MLRMGRNPKAEPNENDKQMPSPQQQQAPAYSVPVPPAVPPSFANPAQPPPPSFETERATRAITETESLAREIKDGTMSGFVGGGTVLSGEAVFKGMLRIDGHLTGRINSDKGTLIVSSGGRVDADVEVATAKINGIVNGDIVASERLELGRAAHVHGNIQTPVLVIEQGAIFEGGCRMTAARTTTTTTTAPQEGNREEKTDTRAANAKGSNGSSNNLPPPPVSGKTVTPEVVNASNIAG